MENHSVFLSWTGQVGSSIAHALKDTILSYPGLETFVSSSDIEVGSNWMTEIDHALAQAASIVVCLTPGASRRAWVNFESGFAYGKLGKVKVVLFNETLPANSPFSRFQAISGYDKVGLVKLLNGLIKREAEAHAFVDFKYEQWTKRLAQILPAPLEITPTLFDASSRLQGALEDLWLHHHAGQGYLEKLVESAIEDLYDQTISIKKSGSFALPYVLYPNILVSLLREFKPIVRAVALIDHDELFWHDAMGDKIRDATTKDSTRLFIFSSQKQVRSYLPKVLEHAKRYNVAAMSYENLIRDFEGQAADFSIIGESENRMIAYYQNDERGRRLIRFSVDPREITDRDLLLNGMMNKAVRIPGNGELDIDSLMDELFRLTPHERRKVEMSTYIHIHDYDIHEKEHAYYKEMVALMLEIQRRERGDAKKCRILEMGAGTGLYTRELARVPGSSVVALELDWGCYLSLDHHIQAMKNDLDLIGSYVECWNEDSRTFNPEGTFRFVTSSFSDHHIRPGDKRKYFRNVRYNLDAGGLFIVGDEFLPPYKNEGAREEALRAYHGHIIDIARSQGHHVLVQLEEAALESGLRALGDFKLSCDEYEKLVDTSGLTIARKEKIGPLNQDDVGGVYVYVMKANS